jgi:hypothetical protein
VAAFNAAPPPSAKPAAAVAPKKLDVAPTKDSKKG